MATTTMTSPTNFPAAGPSNHRRSLSVQTEYGVMQPESVYYDAAAQNISNLIDEELKKEAQARKDAKRKTVKVLLLGQAESGKSTLQKQFQLYYASQSLDHERPSWVPIVHFNVVKAVRMILDELYYDFSRPDAKPQSDESQADIAALRAKLLTLIAIEDSFANELNGGISVSGGRTGVFVRGGWQTLVSSTRTWPLGDSRPKSHVAATLAARTLGTLEDDIETLWRHPAVRRLLRQGKLRLDESAPFFLNNLKRVTEVDYLPTTEDILNVRLQTLGVVEHTFPILLRGTMYEWKLYDVGGARGQRPKWIPFFDDATAVIFLAPVSAFDQYLEEDRQTNRIDDSLQLFTAICSNELLKEAHLVLLLNKTDLLKKKIDDGVRVNSFITSYGTRPNTFKDVAEYFRAHFAQIHRRKDPAARTLYMHFTSMLDIKATQRIIANVGEAIIRQHIEQSGLLG